MTKKRAEKKIGVPIRSRRFSAVVFVDPDRLEEAKAFHSQEWEPKHVSVCHCNTCAPRGSYEDQTRLAGSEFPVGYPPVSFD